MPHTAQPICSGTCIPYTCVAWLVESLCVEGWWGKVYVLLWSGRRSSKSAKQVNTAHLLQEQRSFNSHFTSRSLISMCWVLCDPNNLVRKVILALFNAETEFAELDFTPYGQIPVNYVPCASRDAEAILSGSKKLWIKKTLWSFHTIRILATCRTGHNFIWKVAQETCGFACMEFYQRKRQTVLCLL